MAASLLEVGAQEGARRIALAQLDAAAQAAARLEDPSDTAALHDLRVALRRLRSFLRAYDALLGESVGRKGARRLRKLSRSTGPARDAEVQLAWIASLDEVAPAHQAGVDRLARELERRKEEAYARAREAVREGFPKLERRLRERLSTYERVVRVGNGSSESAFAEVAARAIETEMDALREQLGGLERLDDEGRVHRARIAGKRLRYLLEPFRDEIEVARDAVRTLKSLQDRLGELNDLDNLAATVGQTLEDAALERARRLRAAAMTGGSDLERVFDSDEHRGLVALLTRIHSDRVRLFEHVRETWMSPGRVLDSLERDVEGIVARLVEPPSRGVEIERKYLLRELPPVCLGREADEIDQGYLPGERLVERVRRKRGPSGVKYVRTVKLGEGMVRIEVEEECTEEVFTQLWPLTEGRRLTKRRYTIEDGELAWEIDAFTDRDLVLAEIELPSEGIEVKIPDWLAPYVEREVTGESAYVNVNLAR